MKKDTKKAILGMLSAGENICLPEDIICALIEHKHPATATRLALDSLIKEEKVVRKNRGSCELFMLPGALEREKQRPAKIYTTYPSSMIRFGLL